MGRSLSSYVPSTFDWTDSSTSRLSPIPTPSIGAPAIDTTRPRAVRPRSSVNVNSSVALLASISTPFFDVLKKPLAETVTSISPAGTSVNVNRPSASVNCAMPRSSDDGGVTRT